jgi:hypothetical protein
VLVSKFVVIENFVEPRKASFPERDYDRGDDGGKEGRPSEWMSKEERKQSHEESCKAEWDEVDKGDGEEQGNDGGGEKEGRVRRLIG